MNIQPFRTLVAIAEHRSFAVAAEHLFLTPAAVSQQMRVLEDELQVSLFDRTTRPPRLNAHGTFVAEQAREVLRSFDTLVDAAKAPDEIAGRLALGCINGISSDLVPQALANLRRRYPGLQIRLEERQSGQLIQQVRRRELDAAIVTEPLVPEPELEMMPILSDDLLVLAPPDSTVQSWDAALTELPFLRFNRTSGLGQLIDATIRSAGLVVTEAMELDSSEAMVGMVQAGLGAGVVPAGYLRGEDVRTFPFGTPPVVRRVVLVERLNHQQSDLSHLLYLELKRLSADEHTLSPSPK